MRSWAPRVWQAGWLGSSRQQPLALGPSWPSSRRELPPCTLAVSNPNSFPEQRGKYRADGMREAEGLGH